MGFRACDLDKNGFWSIEEFRALQVFRFGEGTFMPGENDQHFLDLCSGVGADPTRGLDFDDIKRVSDDSTWPPDGCPCDVGYYFDEEELRDFLVKWYARPS